MPFDKKALPAPPEFPASNASYNKIVGKMHKAALGASTAAAAIAAVQSISAHVGGVNTYAKATRRYGDNLITAINGEPAPVKAKKGKTTITVDTAGGPTEVDLKKLEVDPSKHPGGIKEAAAKGDPVAGFMLKGAAAQKAVETITAGHAAVKAGAKAAADVDAILAASAGGGRAFGNKSNAKRALAKDQLDHLPVTWEQVGDKVRPVLHVTDGKGALYAAERGYASTQQKADAK